jgi:hypothetical protein
LVKNGRVGVRSTMALIHSMSFIFIQFNNKYRRKQWKRAEKTKNGATLNHRLHFASSNHELLLSSFFCLVFAQKWCHVSQITIWFVCSWTLV